MPRPSVTVYPAFNARYYSPYIEGLRRVLGSSALSFSSRGFPRFDQDCLAFRYRQGDAERRIYIHSNDMPELSEAALQWCDVFGKVNLDLTLVPEADSEKVFPIGPMFAIQVWGAVQAEAMGIYTFSMVRDAGISFRDHIGNYRGQYRYRFPESQYRPVESDPGYIFYNAALWEREPQANEVRARFVEAARSARGIRFEGGLSPRLSARGSHDFVGPEYEKYLSPRFTSRQNLKKTQASVVAFNNPAYRDCHSWRLGEYLALGKAIITTPIVREVPAPLVHGSHVHYVDGSVEGVREAVEHISSDTEYRQHLERGARSYYDAHLSPQQTVTRALQHAGVPLPETRARIT